MDEQWPSTRLKYVAGFNKRVLSESTPVDMTFKYIDISAVTQGSISIPDHLTSFGDAPSRARRMAEPGDTIISTVRTYLRAVATVPGSDDNLVFSTGFAVLHPRSDMSKRFLSYAVQGDSFVDKVIANSVGVSYPAINSSELMALEVPHPPLLEQRAIADYLDQETAQIDALVAKQEGLLGLLAERKRSILDHLLADVDGDVRRLRWLFRPSLTANTPDEEVLSVYRDYGVIPKSSRSDNFNKTPENVDRYLLVRPGDLVVNKMKAWQGSLGISSYRGIVSGDYEVLRPTTDDLNPAFAHFVMRSPQMILEYRVRSRGIRPSQWRLYWQDLADVTIRVPSLEAQHRVATQIEMENSRIDTLITKAEEHIALAKERRSALITAAVTGQIDVRTAREAS